MQHKIERFKIRTLFFGSGSFALVILKALLKADFLDVIGVITQPDKPFGRKRKIKHTLVKGYLNSLRFSGKIFDRSRHKGLSQLYLFQEKWIFCRLSKNPRRARPQKIGKTGKLFSKTCRKRTRN